MLAEVLPADLVLRLAQGSHHLRFVLRLARDSHHLGFRTSLGGTKEQLLGNLLQIK